MSVPDNQEMENCPQLSVVEIYLKIQGETAGKNWEETEQEVLK